MTEIFHNLLPLTSSDYSLFSFDMIVGQAPAIGNNLSEQLAFLPPPIVKLLGAIAILILGWVVAVIVASLTRNLLKRTDLDNRLASLITGRSEESMPHIEQWVATVVFWVIFIIAIVAFLDALELRAVAEPLNGFLNQIFTFVPKLGGAAILLAIAWVLATVSKGIVVRMAQSFSLDQRLSPSEEGSSNDSVLLSETLGNALYWFIFLFFLPLILGVLDLQGPLEPIQNLINELLSALPKIAKALLIAGIGWFLARIVRSIVTNLLKAAGTDRLSSRLKLNQSSPSQTPSSLVGTLVYVLILIPTATAALDALQIEAISAPAISMLNQILGVVPQIFTAGLVLAIAYFISQFIADIVKSLLMGLGFDNLFNWLGLAANSPPSTSTETTEEAETLDSETPNPETIASELTAKNWTPSEGVAITVQVGIMLFALVAATNILNIPTVTTIMAGLLVIFGQVLVGLIILGVGLYLANFAFSLIVRSGSKESRFIGQATRIAIICLVTAMALQQMGIASNIVNLAFGLLLGAIAVAVALAFGLGGRDIAAEKTREWLSSFRQD